MKKSVLISIHPKWVRLIASGDKTLEVRKTRPKLDTPFKVYIYQTLPKYGDWNERDGNVVGEFVCDYIQGSILPADGLVDIVDVKNSCLTAKEIIRYARGKTVYFWHISEPKMYHPPRELCEYLQWSDKALNGWYYKSVGCPPQSFMYVAWDGEDDAED